MSLDDWKLGAIHEDIFLNGVAMKIQEHEEILTVDGFIFGDQFLESKDFGEYCFLGVSILSIEVFAGNPCPIVSKRYAIWVQHRNDFENKIFPHFYGLFRFPTDIVDETLHHVGTIRLPWMRSAWNNYTLLRYFKLIVSVE